MRVKNERFKTAAHQFYCLFFIELSEKLADGFVVEFDFLFKFLNEFIVIEGSAVLTEKRIELFSDLLFFVLFYFS